MESIGIVEVVGVVAAVEALDAMSKASNVSFTTSEKKLGGRLVTVIVKGNVDDVTAAVEVGIAAANRVTSCVASAVIARPHEEVLALIEKSGIKYNR